MVIEHANQDENARDYKCPYLVSYLRGIFLINRRHSHNPYPPCRVSFTMMEEQSAKAAGSSCHAITREMKQGNDMFMLTPLSLGVNIIIHYAINVLKAEKV